MADLNQKLGDYLILERLAQGGMAEIYKAKTVDPLGIERLVVIKRILPHISSDPEYVEMLVDEAKIAVHFTHGNIAQIYDLGKTADDYFIVMEYVDGKTVGQIIREFRERGQMIPLEIVVYCLMEVCRGLDYIHRKADSEGQSLGVVHRDVSPQNIIVSYSGTVKIIDFGVAKAHLKTGQTESGVLKGKFAYMSPEQASGEVIDRRSDIFSAGVILWEMLIQERLFKRASNKETVQAVRKDHPKPPSRLRLDVPRELDRIVAKALEKKSSKRYQYASEVADDLGRFLLSLKPEFRPIQVAQFLYRYFGPEPDEEGLPPELPELKIPREPKRVDARKVLEPDEEKTEVDAGPSFWSKLAKSRIVWIGALCLVLAGGIVSAAILVPPYFKGTLVLRINPSDARVTIDDKAHRKGESPLTLVRPARQPFHVRVEKEGFLPFETTVVLAGRERRNLSVTLEKEVPPYGDLFVSTEPPGALVTLNEIQWSQKTPVRIPHLEHNKKYHVRVFLEGYKEEGKEVSIEGGETVQLKMDLKVDYATLEIRSSPDGADVIIDEQGVGKTPYTMRSVKPGEEVEIVLQMEGFETVKEEVELKPGETKTLSYELKKK